MADKTAALTQLIALQLPTPVTLVVTRLDLERLRHFVAENAGIGYWYLRFDERLAPALPRVANTQSLFALVDGAIRNQPSLTVIVQERVPAARAGVLAVTPDAVFVEYVTHELQALLRLGVTPTRLLLSREGWVIADQSNTQEFHYRWDGLEFVREALGVVPSPLGPDVRSQLVKAATHVAETALLEWIERDNGRIVYLDYRAMRQDFLCEKSALVRGLKEGMLRNFSPELEDRAKTRGAGLHHFDLDRPFHEYAASVLPQAESLSFAAGGILSHLSVYAAEQGVYCTVARPKQRAST